MIGKTTCVVSGLWILFAAAARAETVTIYVAPKGSPAAEAATKKAAADGGQVVTSFFKALPVAAEIASKPGARTVNVLVSGDAYRGQLGMGMWALPLVDNPAADVHVVGGFDPTFTRRSFATLTRLETAPDRGGPFLQITKGSQIHELVISGFVFDAAPSNTYDAASKSLSRSKTRTVPLITFGQLHTDHLVIADNAFLNAPEGVFDPLIAPVSDDTTIDIQNNLFWNNLLTLRVGSGFGFRGKIVRRVRLTHNTFLCNWPYNPDPTSSNVGAVELHHKGSAEELDFVGNLFAHNPGGALQQDWAVDRMPTLKIEGNLFFQNATLFGNDQDAAGVLVGKFGAAPTYRVLDLDAVSEGLDYGFEKNVSLDPGLDAGGRLRVGKADRGDDETGGEGDDSEGDTDVEIHGFAPAAALDLEHFPLPNEAARAYGVQPDHMWGD